MMRTRFFILFSAFVALAPLAGCPLGGSASPDVAWLSQFSPPPDTSGPADTNPAAARERSLLGDVLATLIESAGLATSSSDGSSASIVPAASPGDTLLPDGRTVLELVSSWNIPQVSPPAAPPSPPVIPDPVDPAPPPPPSPMLDPTLDCYSGVARRVSNEFLSSYGEYTMVQDDYALTACFDPDPRRLRVIRVPGNFAIADVDLRLENIGDTVTVTQDVAGSTSTLNATLLSIARRSGTYSVTLAVEGEFECPPFVVRVEGTQTIDAIQDGGSIEYSSVSRLEGYFGNADEVLDRFAIETTLGATLTGPR